MKSKETVSTNSRKNCQNADFSPVTSDYGYEKHRDKIVPLAGFTRDSGKNRAFQGFQQQREKKKKVTPTVWLSSHRPQRALSQSPTNPFIRLLKLRGRTADLSPMLKSGKTTMQAFTGTTESLIVRKYRKLSAAIAWGTLARVFWTWWFGITRQVSKRSSPRPQCNATDTHGSGSPCTGHCLFFCGGVGVGGSAGGVGSF